MTTTPDTRGSVLPFLAAVILLVVGRLVPLPGVNGEVLSVVMATGPLAAALPVLGLLGGTVPWLAFVQLALIFSGFEAKPRARLVAAAFYLLVAALQGLGIALYLESVNDSFVGLVSFPGWGFRSTAVLAWTTGAAVLWLVADAIERTGRAHGALFLLLMDTVLTYAVQSERIGDAYGRGTASPVSAVLWGVMPLALVLVSVVMCMRPPARWPLMMGRWPVRSAWDGLALVSVGAIPQAGLVALLSAMAPESLLPEWATWVEAVVAIVVAAGLVTSWWRAGDAQARPRPFAALALALGFTGVVGVAAGIAYDASGGAEPPPLAGDQSFELVLEAVDEFAPGDADAMVARIEDLGADAEVAGRSRERITLRVSDARGVEPVLEALVPNDLHLHLVADLFALGDPSVETLALRPLPSPYETPTSGEGDCDALTRWREQTPDDDACLYRIEAGDRGTCTLHCLSPESILTSEDVDSAEAVIDELREAPAIVVELDADAAERFGRATGEHVRHRLAIVVDDELVAAPVINAEIEGGRFQISLPRPATDDADASLARAASMAAAFRSGHRIRSRWTLVRVDH